MDSDSDPVTLAFGRALRSLRRQRRLTQETFARQCDSHRNYVGALERGETSPTLRVQARLATGLGISLTELAQEIDRQLLEMRPPSGGAVDGVAAADDPDPSRRDG
jgi:transcriptional regulator with XRE-family HTH domain